MPTPGMPTPSRPLAIQEKQELGTGGRIYEGGQLLSEVLLSEYRQRLPSMRVLELGSGTGIGGLTAAAAGARVLLTDGAPELLPLLEANVRRNAEAGSLRGSAEVRLLRWGDERDTEACLLYTSPSPRDATLSRMPSSA